MPTARDRKLKSRKKKGLSLWEVGLLAFMLYVGLAAIIFGLDVRDGKLLSWSPLVMIICTAAIFYIFGIWSIYTVSKSQGRNTVRWMTAAIVFSPVLAWIAFGLSWRKSQ